MGLVEKEFVEQHITPERADAIYECIMYAIDTYRSKYENLRYNHSARTDASIIHDLIVANVQKQFENDSNVYCCRKNNLFLMSIDNGAVKIRFKKMDKKLRVQNIPTQQSFAFSHQLALFGPSVNINAGYQLNGLNVSVFITCPENNYSNSWYWKLEPQPSKVVRTIHKGDLPTTTRQVVAKVKEQKENGI